MPLDSKVEQQIDCVFKKALNDGRRYLYEFEVYTILKALGLQVPDYIFITDPCNLDEEQLAPFLPKAMAKIVSPDLAHKSRYGGVRPVSVEDPLYVRFVLNAMKEEVLSHFDADTKPKIDGFLISEFIPFTQALGNEVLIGAREDPAFGPTVTLSKGGDDAEFFARWYDPANVSIAPLSMEEAYRISHGLKIRYKLEAEGRTEDCNRIAEALYAISLLAYRYSFSIAKGARFHLLQLDINPFVFSRKDRGAFIAVDGFAEFAVAQERKNPEPRPPVSSLEPFFMPRNIAVVGVSSDTQKYSMARIIVGLLSELGRDDIYCLNPKGGEAKIANKVFTLYKSVQELPAPCSLYVFAAPAPGTRDFLETVPEGSAVILISGIAEDYENFAELVHKHRSRGIRIIGPNCMGVFFAPDDRHPGINTLFLGEERLPLRWTKKSNVALFSQSGAMGITAVERAQYAPIYKAIVSFGNKADVNVPDLIRYFSTEKTVALMAVYLEGLGCGEGRELFCLAEKLDKPLIIYKAGRTEAGAKAAASHTASMSGDYDVFQAACRQAGIILVDELPDFYNTVKAFSMLLDTQLNGLHVGGVVNAGLDATMGADLLGSLQPGSYSPETIEKLKKLNIHALLNVGASFLDVTPMTDDQLFSDIVDCILADEQTDCAFIAIVPHIETLKTTDEVCSLPDALGPLLVQTARKYNKPLVVSVNSGNRYQGFVRVLEEGGLPVYPDIRSAMRALECFCIHKHGPGQE